MSVVLFTSALMSLTSCIISTTASEVYRQTALLDSGLAVAQETQGFDEQRGETFKLRSKEDAPDYRYMPDPNLPPLLLTEVSESFRTLFIFSLTRLRTGLCQSHTPRSA
jgi:Asp-tRNA(Asn)/Glu-tRNA(Gln) amidotransferase B subunit